MRGPRVVTAALLAVVVAGCAGVGPGATTGPGTSSLPACDAVPTIAAPPALYRDTPIYVANEMPAEAVQAWAAGKPGFEAIWIDRDHHGWVTVAFSVGAAERQAELAAEFPGAGVVAVAVPWRMRDLEALQNRVIEAARSGRVTVTGAGIDIRRGVVTIGAGVLTADTVDAIEALFAGTRACIEGIDPADAPAEGPQQPAGEGWRLLADEDRVGGPYRTGIATDAASLEALWSEVGLSTALPSVDFEADVVVWFGAVHGSSCPRLRLDGVAFDAGRGVLHAEITLLDTGACTADAIGHAYVVAVARSMLPHGPFRIQLQATDPPPGVIDSEVTIVNADLSIPGSSLQAGQLASPTPYVDEGWIQDGDIIEPGIPYRYRLRVACGIEWLGELNDVEWRRSTSPGGAPVPGAWADAVGPDGTIELAILLLVEPTARVEATAAGHTETYVPSAERPPACS